MNLSRLFGFLLILALASCASTNPTPSSQRAEIGQIDTAQKLAADHRDAEADAAIQSLINTKNFRELPSAEQYRALLTASKLASTLNAAQLEYEDWVRLVALPEATADDRMSRFKAAYRLKNAGEIIASLTDVVQKVPGGLEHVNYRFILFELGEAKKALPHGASFPLMQALFAAHWKLEWGVQPSATWQDLALLLLEQNRLAEAIDVATRVEDEYALISMRANRRFDAITAANPAHFDVEAALRRHIEHYQAISETTPKALAPTSMVISLLMEQQRYGGALAAADGLIADIQMRNDPKQWYGDYDEQFAWVLNDRARVLQRVGRWDEAVEQLAAASRVVNEDGNNVSQVINLGELYCDLGRPKDALQALDRLGPGMSDYGHMQEGDARLDAAIQLADADATAKWLGFIREHRVDAPRTYEDALLRMNDVDAAARWLIERLENPDLQSATLTSIQQYAIPSETQRQAELRKRRGELMARPDVQAEIAKFGRVESYKIEGMGQ